jgi:adenylate cyclase
MVVELIASQVAHALARLEQEQVALKARIQFEQFFIPELARELEASPSLLDGREAEVTVLFCDIRGFSTVSHRIGPRQTMAWINDVLDILSACVVEHRGVLVDYIGDELMAMWGAPEQSNDHAERACSAALDMIQRLAVIDEKWEPGPVARHAWHRNQYGERPSRQHGLSTQIQVRAFR